MEQTQPDVSELLGRVVKLERQNRAWRLGGLAALLALAFFVAAGVRAQQDQRPALRAATVEAHHFILQGDGGVTQGELMVSNGQPVLELYDASGKVIWSTQVGVHRVTK
jgi:hypothetical protein